MLKCEVLHLNKLHSVGLHRELIIILNDVVGIDIGNDRLIQS